MRKQLGQSVEAGRIRHGLAASSPGDGWGAFVLMGPTGAELRILVTDGVDPEALGWEHVSVSCAAKRCPNWPEMAFVKDCFWDDDETVIQFHPPKSQYVNCHPTTLHLWKPRERVIETPDPILIGPVK